MAIARISALRDRPLAVDALGDAVGDEYDRRRRAGLLAPVLPPELPRGDDDLDHYVEHALAEPARALRADAPVVAMVHGFMFDPFSAARRPPHDSDNPHARLFHFQHYGDDARIRLRAPSWPIDLGFADDDGETGLALAFGWHSRPGFAGSLIKGGRNFYVRAYDYAEQSSWVLAAFLESVHRRLEETGRSQPLDLVAHSLGARVVVRMLAQVLKYATPTDEALAQEHRTVTERRRAEERRERLAALARRLGRIVILGGSEYVVEAQLMYRRLLDAAAVLGLEPGEGPQIYNVVSRENDILDFLGENFGPRTFGNTNVIGHNGIGLRMEQHRTAPDARWCDLPIDSAELQRWMEARGVIVSGDRPGQVWDHWYYYTHAGNMDLYRRILREHEGWSIPELVAAGVPQRIGRDWLFGD